MQKLVEPYNDSEYELLTEIGEFEEFEEHDKLEKTSYKTKKNISKETVNIIQLFNNPNLPMMILDKNLNIIHSTPLVHQIFQDYYIITERPFFNIFLHALEAHEMQEFLVSIKSFDRGFSWTGTMRHKTPTTKTLYTHTILSPLFSSNSSIAGYQVFFEDISLSHFKQLHATFQSILEAAKLKDNDTGMHDERVGYYSKKMSEYLYAIKKYPQIDPDYIQNIEFLACMHDVGKIGTPDYILQKPGKLNESEWEIMREHTINGTFILSSYPIPMAKEIALSHHEWWNGSGYPFKLEGEMIPLSARIVTIADVYDALRMKRTYKVEYSHEEAVARIIEGKGTQFDPELVDVFTRIHNDFDDIWILLRDTALTSPVPRDRSKEFGHNSIK